MGIEKKAMAGTKIYFMKVIIAVRNDRDFQY